MATSKKNPFFIFLLFVWEFLKMAAALSVAAIFAIVAGLFFFALTVRDFFIAKVMNIKKKP